MKDTNIQGMIGSIAFNKLQSLPMFLATQRSGKSFHLKLNNNEDINQLGS